jgi:hypothetical protein
VFVAQQFQAGRVLMMGLNMIKARKGKGESKAQLKIKKKELQWIMKKNNKGDQC